MCDAYTRENQIRKKTLMNQVISTYFIAVSIILAILIFVLAGTTQYTWELDGGIAILLLFLVFLSWTYYHQVQEIEYIFRN